MSGQRLTAPVTLPPRSAAVFYLSTDALAAIAPATPVVVRATASTGSVTVTWDAVPGATSYRVARALGGARPFIPVTGSVAVTTYVDTSVVSGTDTSTS